jgi:KUP system potassium uptake protein
VLHTSVLERGQIYVPVVNWTLMVACIGLVLGFGSSSRLAGAYGVGVTMTMVIDSLLLFLIARERWHWPTYRAAVLIAGFLVVDLGFFGANLFKIPEGGWFPLLISALVFALMSTWRRGRQFVGERLRGVSVSLVAFRDSISRDPPTRIPGTVVFLHRAPMTVPPAMLSILRTSHSLPSEAVLLAVITDEELARVPAVQRATVTEIGDGFFQIELRFGFAEQPDVPKALSEMFSPKFGFVPEATVYVLGTERVVPTSKPGMATWREEVFAVLYRNASPAAMYFGLPADRVIEIGQQVEL